MHIKACLHATHTTKSLSYFYRLFALLRRNLITQSSFIIRPVARSPSLSLTFDPSLSLFRSICHSLSISLFRRQRRR